MYVWYDALATMNNTKIKNRGQFGNENSLACLRTASTTISVDTNAIVDGTFRPQISHLQVLNVLIKLGINSVPFMRLVLKLFYRKTEI